MLRTQLVFGQFKDPDISIQIANDFIYNKENTGVLNLTTHDRTICQICTSV